jgi:hypothetical protein
VACHCPATLTGLLPILSIKSRLKQKNGRTAEKSYIFVPPELLFYGLKKNPYFSQLPDIFFVNAAIQATLFAHSSASDTKVFWHIPYARLVIMDIGFYSCRKVDRLGNQSQSVRCVPDWRVGRAGCTSAIQMFKEASWQVRR